MRGLIDFLQGNAWTWVLISVLALGSLYPPIALAADETDSVSFKHIEGLNLQYSPAKSATGRNFSTTLWHFDNWRASPCMAGDDWIYSNFRDNAEDNGQYFGEIFARAGLLCEKVSLGPLHGLFAVLNLEFSEDEITRKANAPVLLYGIGTNIDVLGIAFKSAFLIREGPTWQVTLLWSKDLSPTFKLAGFGKCRGSSQWDFGSGGPGGEGLCCLMRPSVVYFLDKSKKVFVQTFSHFEHDTDGNRLGVEFALGYVF